MVLVGVGLETAAGGAELDCTRLAIDCLPLVAAARMAVQRCCCHRKAVPTAALAQGDVVLAHVV